MNVVLSLSFVCTVIFTGISLWHFYYRKEIDGFLVISLMYDLVFGILPMIISWQIVFNGSQSVYIKSILDLSDEGILALLYYYLYSVIGFFAMFLGYFGKFKGLNLYINGIKTKKMEYKDSLLFIVTWICLIIGSISLYLWSKAYGSIFVLMRNANRVRSGYGGVINNLAFFKHPAKIVMLCTLMFLTLILKSGQKSSIKTIGNIVGISISGILSYLYLIANDGRLTILIFLMAILWLCIAGKKIKSVSKTIVLGSIVVVMGMVLLIQMDAITNFIRFGTWTSGNNHGKLFSSIIRELGFLVQGGQTSILAAWRGKVKLTIGDDFVTGILAWLPSKFKSAKFKDVWNINTILIYGDLSVLHGQAPCSIITQAFYDLRLIGIITFSILIGRFTKKVDDWKLSNEEIVKFAIKANILEILFRAVPYFSLYDMILGFFPLVIMLVVYKVVDAIAITSKKELSK